MSKYHNRKTTIDNITFDSLKEAVRYSELKLLLKAGKIKNLELQPEFILQEGYTDIFGKKHRPIIYIADFSYWETNNPAFRVVEDVKGMRTEVYKLKKKLLLFQYKYIDFREI